LCLQNHKRKDQNQNQILDQIQNLRHNKSNQN
jgi:hypothetical protein